MEIKKLVELKNEIKARKPTFLRQDAHKKKKVNHKWRQPKGMDSKVRRRKGGKRRMPSMGFSSPRLVRGLNKEGMLERLVKNLNDLKSFDAKTEVVVLADIGIKKRIELIKKCEELKLKIVNIKDTKKYLENIEKKKAEKKELKKKRENKKVEIAKDNEKKKKKSEKESDKVVKDEEETNKKEKSEKVKVLEKRQ